MSLILILRDYNLCGFICGQKLKFSGFSLGLFDTEVVRKVQGFGIKLV